jgi:hypothetical protein
MKINRYLTAKGKAYNPTYATARQRGQDYAKLPMSSGDYYDFATATSDQEMLFNSQYKHSEFKAPQGTDDYFDMDSQYNYQFDYPGLWGDIPGGSLPWSPKGKEPEPDPGIIVCNCSDGSYCPGAVSCFEITCTYDMAGVSCSSYDPRFKLLSFKSVVGQKYDVSHKGELCLWTPAGYNAIIYCYFTLTSRTQAPCIGMSRIDGFGCKCNKEVIVATSGQMNVNTSQSLGIQNTQPGQEYTWMIISGGGSLSPLTGASTTYTAPASNPSCNANTTIGVFVGGQLCSSVYITINGWSGNGCAYVQCAANTTQWYLTYPSCSRAWRCDGVGDVFGACSGGESYTSSSVFCNWWPVQNNYKWNNVLCNGAYSYGINDSRTAEMIAGGCCPSALF